MLEKSSPGVTSQQSSDCAINQILMAISIFVSNNLFTFKFQMGEEKYRCAKYLVKCSNCTASCHKSKRRVSSLVFEKLKGLRNGRGRAKWFGCQKGSLKLSEMKYFSFGESDEEPQHITCKICNKVISAAQGNTINLFNHIEEKNITFDKLMKTQADIAMTSWRSKNLKSSPMVKALNLQHCNFSGVFN